MATGSAGGVGGGKLTAKDIATTDILENARYGDKKPQDDPTAALRGNAPTAKEGVAAKDATASAERGIGIGDDGKSTLTKRKKGGKSHSVKMKPDDPDSSDDGE
jgi:hypothetical protein